MKAKPIASLSQLWPRVSVTGSQYQQNYIYVNSLSSETFIYRQPKSLGLPPTSHIRYILMLFYRWLSILY